MTLNNINRINASISDLARRKKISREFIRSLTPLEKVGKLVDLQRQYYEMLLIRERNGGPAIPEKWSKWYRVRSGESL